MADSSAPSCYADDGELTALLAQTLRSTATGVALAWHFRQRDGAQALQFADAADAALANAVDISPEARISMQARVQLIRAEVATLLGQFSVAESALTSAKKIAPETAVCTGDLWLAEAMLASN